MGCFLKRSDTYCHTIFYSSRKPFECVVHEIYHIQNNNDFYITNILVEDMEDVDNFPSYKKVCLETGKDLEDEEIQENTEWGFETVHYNKHTVGMDFSRICIIHDPSQTVHPWFEKEPFNTPWKFMPIEQ